MLSQNHRTARVVDTRLEANSENQVTYVVEEGPAVANYVPLPSASHSIQNTVFNLNNIADRTCRDSRMVLAMQVVLTMNVTNGGAGSGVPITSDNFGFKQYPLNKCINSIQHQINQASYTLLTSQMLDAIARLNSFPVDANFYENTAPDLIDSYANATATHFNPLRAYSDTEAGDGIYKPRTLNWTVSGNNNVSPGGTATVVVTANLYEPLISPFNNISSKNRRGLYAITGEIITIQWVSDIASRMFAYAPTNIVGGPVFTVNSSSVSFGSTATLDLIYLTPYENYIKEIPHNSVYQYNEYQIWSNNVGACPAGSVLQSKATQVVNFTNIPQKILIFARLADSSITMATPDKYLTISNVSCQFDNGQPQLNSASTRQLYDISKRNGLCMPACAFQQLQLNTATTNTPLYGCGSVLVLDPALDLGIRPGSSTGSKGRYIFQATLNLTNNTGTSFPSCTLYVVGISAAVLERNGSEYKNGTIALPDNVLYQAQNLRPIDHQSYMDSKHSNAFLSGGGVGDWFKKAFDFAKQGAKWALDNPETVKKGVAIAENVGSQIKDRYKNMFNYRKGKGGAELLYDTDMRPAQRMDLFYE